MRKWQAIPVAAVAAFLAGAALFTSAPPVVRAASPVTLALVCQVTPSCVFVAGTTGIDVDVIVTNSSGSSISIANFNFEIYSGNSAFLTPSTPVPNAPGFNCTTSPPVADNGAYGSGATGSTVSCFNPASPAGDIVIADGFTATLGTVHFAAAGPDSVDLILTNVTVAGVTDFVACDPDAGPPAAPTGAGLADCTGATVIVGQGGATSTQQPPATSTGTPLPTATPCVANCPAPTTLAFKTITPNAGTLTATAPTKVPATAVPGGPPPPPPTGNLPGGGAGAGGSRPITLPDTGAGANTGINWTAAALLSLLAVAIGGATGALYLGAAHVSASRRGRDN